MKFILGLLIGGGLVFGWYYMHGASKTDAAIFPSAAENVKLRADYEMQLKSVGDQVECLNKELLQTRAALLKAQAGHTNMVETVDAPPRLEQPVNKPEVAANPGASAPSPVPVTPKVAQPASKKVVPVKSGLGGPRPSSQAKQGVAVTPPAGGGLMYKDGQGRSYRIVNGKRIYY